MVFLMENLKKCYQNNVFTVFVSYNATFWIALLTEWKEMLLALFIVYKKIRISNLLGVFFFFFERENCHQDKYDSKCKWVQQFFVNIFVICHSTVILSF